jgi:uncharacterized membrane protein
MLYARIYIPSLYSVTVPAILNVTEQEQEHKNKYIEIVEPLLTINFREE